MADPGQAQEQPAGGVGTAPPRPRDGRPGSNAGVTRFYRAAAIVFVAYPILVLLTRRPPLIEGLLVLAGTGLFVGLLTFAARPPGSPSRSSPVGPVIVILLLFVSSLLVVRDPGSGFYPFFFYASAGASALLPARRAVALMALAGLVGGVAFYLAMQDVVGALVQGLSVTIIGVTVFSASELRRTNRDLVEARGELARLAVADERVRIARDLHDTLGQSLSVITLKSELAGRLLPEDPVRAQAEVRDIEVVAREAMASVRETVVDSRRPTLEGELAAARKAHVAADIAPSIEAAADGLPPVVDAVLAWTVREGVTNAVRHSGARRVRIQIGRQGAWAEASITDDGGAEHQATSAQAGAGSGLTGLSERVAALGGRFEAGPISGGGFRINVSLPLEPVAS